MHMPFANGVVDLFPCKTSARNEGHSEHFRVSLESTVSAENLGQ